MKTHHIVLHVVVLLLLVQAGCDSRPKRVPVSGKVLIDGEPLKFGTVVFVPEHGRQSTGALDETGSFTLTCYDPDDGALVGKHRVEILSSQAINSTTIKWHAPQKYADRKTSELIQEVSGPTDSIVFNLTWKGSPPEKPFLVHSDPNAGEEAFGRSRRKKPGK